jgi:hypothetical protein
MTTTLADLLLIKRQAEQFLTPLVRATPEELVRALRPRPEDYARVFVDAAIARAQTGFGELWNAPPKSLGKPTQTEVRAIAGDAASFRDDNDISKAFPGGYRKIAHLLVPDVVWVSFKLTAPGESLGMAHDGLVKLDDRWAWFPKPWRVLGEDTIN